jgi:hypothetical protein
MDSHSEVLSGGFYESVIAPFASGILSLALYCSRLSLCQSLPVPEYFGVYAVIEGKLRKLDSQEYAPTNWRQFGWVSGWASVVVQRQPANL